MDENKELLTNKSEEEANDKGYDLKTFEENTEEEISENNNESTENNEETIENSFSEIENSSSESVAKKQPILQKTILVSIAILLAFLASFLVVKCFFNTSIVGTWLLDSEGTATSDEATLGEKEKYNVYYTFNSDGEVITTSGTAKSYATYTLQQNEEGTSTVTAGLFGGLTVDYRIEGNAITGRKLIISYNGEDVFTFKSAHLTETKIEPPKDFKVDEKLLGKWYDGSGVSEEHYYNVYEFMSDGTCLIDSAQYDYYTGTITPIKINATYVIADDQITVTYKMVDENNQLQDVVDAYPFAYDEENDVFVMNGLGFYRVNDDCSFVSTPDQLVQY